MTKIKPLINKLKIFLKSVKNEHISSFAAHVSFFLILSFFPMISLIISLIKLNGGAVQIFTNVIIKLLPYIDHSYVENIFTDFGLKVTSVISFSSLLAAWSSGKSFYALYEAFSSILKSKNQKGYFFLRFRFLLFSFIFALVIVVLFFIGVFGGKINSFILYYFPDYPYIISFVQKLFVFFVLFIILFFIYLFLPEKTDRLNYKSCFIASLFSSLIICLYTAIFSLFADIYIKYSSFYGGIATFISAMLWIYGSIYILILGFWLIKCNMKNNS